MYRQARQMFKSSPSKRHRAMWLKRFPIFYSSNTTVAFPNHFARHRFFTQDSPHEHTSAPSLPLLPPSRCVGPLKLLFSTSSAPWLAPIPNRESHLVGASPQYGQQKGGEKRKRKVSPVINAPLLLWGRWLTFCEKKVKIM